MGTATVLLALLAAGVNFGWHPAAGAPDGYEYVVQIEPELLEVMRQGETVPIESNVPPEVTPIRKVSIVVGRGDVPRTKRADDSVERTAFFAEQNVETPDRYATQPAEEDEAAAAAQATNPAADWVFNWGSDAQAAPATISRAEASPAEVVDDSQPALPPLEPVQRPLPTSSPPLQETAQAEQPQETTQPPPLPEINWADVFDNDSPVHTPEPPPTAAAVPPAETPTVDAASAAPPAATESNVIPFATTHQTAPHQPTPTQLAPAQSAPVQDEQPWLPLVAVSVALAGSLGANMFLGWSYLEARYRYRTMVRKTADKFRRATSHVG